MMKRFIASVTVLSLTLCGIGIIGLAKSRYSTNKSSMTKDYRSSESMHRRQRFIKTSPAEVRRQRNKLSAMMNTMKVNFAKMACEIEDLKSKLGIKTADDRALHCKRPNELDGQRIPLDEAFAKDLLILWTNQSVAILGDATGSYKRYLDSKHRLQLCDSYDSALYVAETSQGLVRYIDMAAPQYGLPVYDWMMSWQVTEHISGEFMDIFVDNLVRHSGTGLVLVWDDNTSAVNTKTRVHGALRLKGFLLDESKTQKLRESAKADIVKRNAIVYKRTHRLPSPLDA